MKKIKASEVDLTHALNRQTAKIPFSELARFFAAGLVISVDPSLDLVHVAEKLALDDKLQLKAWMAENQVGLLSDEVAGVYTEEDALLWAVVVDPWVVVQEVNACHPD